MIRCIINVDVYSVNAFVFHYVSFNTLIDKASIANLPLRINAMCFASILMDLILCYTERYDLLAPPHPLSRSNSSNDFFSDGDKDDDP